MTHQRSYTVMTVGLLSVALLAGLAACSTSPQGQTPSAAVLSPTPAASVAPTVAGSPSPSLEPTVAPSPTPACSITTDAAPETGTFFNLNGAGFAPGRDIEVTFVDPDGTDTVGGPDYEVQLPALHTRADGSFGPWDIMYEESDGTGDFEIQASDGDCRASVSFTID